MHPHPRFYGVADFYLKVSPHFIFLTQTFADAHTLRLCLPSGWWRKRSVRVCEFFINLNDTPQGLCVSLRILRENLYRTAIILLCLI